MSEQHAYEARQALLQNVARGEARINLADAAFQIAAEDDAIASHAVVSLPIASYQQRLAKTANELARGPLARLPPGAEPADAVKVQTNFLFVQLRCGWLQLTSASHNIALAATQDHLCCVGGRGVPLGAAALPAAFLWALQRACQHCRGPPRCDDDNTVPCHWRRLGPSAATSIPPLTISSIFSRSVTMPHCAAPAGVWEDARHAYLHEVLIRRVGCAAALAVIEADILQRLLAAGAVDFAVRIDCSDLGKLPVPEVRHSA